MNINQEMQSLGDIGGDSYIPSDALVGQLLGRARRARAVRQGTVTVVSAVGVLALGAATAQAINKANEDPAFRDRNIINDTSNLTPIERYKAQYGGGNPTRVLESPVDIKQIVADLKAAAQAADSLKEPGTEETTKPKPGAGTTTTTTKPPTEACVAKDHPDKPYKVWDCATGEWVVKAGWFWNDYSDTFEQCSTQTVYVDKSYDCTQGKWVAKTGYFLFFDDVIYKTITWTDAATGTTATGNYSPSYDKVAFAKPSKNYYDEYKYLEGNASWSGSTCSGDTATIKNAPFRYSCMPDYKITQDNGSGGKVGKQWILQDSNYKWFPNEQVYYCIDTPPAGWTWDGSQWVETPTP